jgi:plastocyanin
VLVIGSALALALAACSSGSPAATSSGGPTGTLAPSSPAASSPVGSASASGVAPASASGDSAADGDTLHLSAQGIQFSTKELGAPAGRPFSIAFENNDTGISHNVDILDANNTSVFKGAVVAGVFSETYHVPARKAGTYSFICDVHPNLMTGTLTVR